MKKLILILLLAGVIVAQNIPIPVEHPIYHFLDQQESLGHVDMEYWSTRPYTYTQINAMLDEIDTYSLELSETNLNILARFQKEFERDIEKEGIKLPWSQATWHNIRHPEKFDIHPFFMTYKLDNTSGWISWSETFRVQYNGEGTRGYHTDHLEISGSKGRIDFTTQYTFYRVTRNDEFAELPDTYKEGYLLDRDYMKWINWGYPTSSLTYTHPDFTLGMHRQPIYWGYSSTNSPILSNNVNPLPYIEWTTQMPHLRFKFIHARLSPNEEVRDDTTNIPRNLSAHRVEFDLGSRFEFAFNEMVIYAHRDFELGYLNPVNFLFAEEQVQGDLDNKLMAIDFKWHVLPGLTSYGTWFFDELDFWKLFSGWWGNKFVFQLGATYYPRANLPSLNIEYTAARPWTYSHIDPINSYSSAGRILGLKNGPNTQDLRIRSAWQAGPRLNLAGEFSLLQRGDDPGSDILNSYSERGNFEDEDSDFITGSILSSTMTHFRAQYYLNSTIALNFLWVGGQGIELGTQLTW